jgi:hypothetical protein
VAGFLDRTLQPTPPARSTETAPLPRLRLIYRREQGTARAEGVLQLRHLELEVMP